jgi:hypothetical protein
MVVVAFAWIKECYAAYFLCKNGIQVTGIPRLRRVQDFRDHKFRRRSMTNTLKAAAFSVALACAMATTSRAQNAAPPPQDPTAPAQTPQSPQGQASAPVAANPAGQTTKIAPGSVIPVELTKTVDAKKAKTGDEVIAKVTHDLKSGSGEVIVAKDTKMIGHVTEAQAHTKEQKQSELGIIFDKAVTKGGEMKLPMSIQAIIAPRQNTPANDAGGGETAPTTGGGTTTSPMANRAPLSVPSRPQQLPAGGGDAQSGSRPAITASTQGVIGMPDVKLETNGQNASQGSVVSSEKNNVKLESGTMLLLRVSQ